MVFTLVGDAYIGGALVKEKTAAKLTAGSYVEIKATDENAQVLFISSELLNEPVAWGGPIVMNTDAELMQAYFEIVEGRFIKHWTPTPHK